MSIRGEFDVLLSIDIGNTRCKIAKLWENSPEELGAFLLSDLVENPGLLTRYLKPAWRILVGWISVQKEVNPRDWTLWQFFESPPDFFPIHIHQPLPIRHAYETPDTLGIDRLVAVLGASTLTPNQAILVIDAGTAITYDFLSAQGVYLGGGIAPGIEMRFQALHDYTSSLPRVERTDKFSLLGNTTASCIRSGVLYGVWNEVSGTIEAYKIQFGSSLKVFLTGGDRSFFENQQECFNFVASDLIHRGIHRILTHNISV